MTTIADIGSTVYHFTDTTRLPWILDDGELRPGTCSRVEGFPPMDFVWATTNENIARSAVAFCGNSNYQNGMVWKIRISLSAQDFVPWEDTVTRMPGWTDYHTKQFYDHACGDNPSEWRTHCGSLPRSKWLAIHARSYLCRNWREIPCDLVVRARANKGSPERIITFGAREFSSIRVQENPMLYLFRITDMLQDRFVFLKPL